MEKETAQKQGKILVIDDDAASRVALLEILDDDYDTVCVESGFNAVEEIKTNAFDLIFLDILMSDMDGIETLKRIKEYDRQLSIIMVTEVDRAMLPRDSLKLGPYDYVKKPFDHEIILSMVKKVLREQNPLRKVYFKCSHPFIDISRSSIVSRSESMSAVFESIEKVAKTSCNVLITGEDGTGKELIAHTIHQNSPRKNNPFVSVNCMSIPANSSGSEFFGHGEGALTGGDRQHIGKIESAHRGSIFIDDIFCLSMELQAKLINFIRNRDFFKENAQGAVDQDVRIIAASTTALDAMVKKNQFRNDLYYELNVVEIKLPSLRQRKEDILPLIDYFLYQFNKLLNKSIKGFTPKALSVLENYPWPGNIRELKSYIERIVVLGSNHQMLDENDLPFGADFICPPPRQNICQKTLLLSKLTSREIKLLELIAQGMGNKEIANRLFISPKTVSNHITNIFKKLSIKSRAQAIVIAREGGLGKAQGEESVSG